MHGLRQRGVVFRVQPVLRGKNEVQHDGARLVRRQRRQQLSMDGARPGPGAGDLRHLRIDQRRLVNIHHHHILRRRAPLGIQAQQGIANAVVQRIECAPVHQISQRQQRKQRPQQCIQGAPAKALAQPCKP